MEQFLGAVVLLCGALLFIDSVGARRGRHLLPALRATPAARRTLMIILSVLAVALILPALIPALRRGLFAFCSVCALSPGAIADISTPESFATPFLLALWYYAATVVPVFVLACLLSGVVAAKADRLPIRGVLASFLLAAVLPVCSCGAIPLGRAIIDRGGSGPRDGLVFIATAPLLSPIIVFLALSALGPAYTIARVGGAVLIAAAAAIIVRPLVSDAGRWRAPSGGLSGPLAGSEGSALLAGWRYLTNLIRYVLYGVVIGALFTALVPPDYVAAIIRSGVASLAAAVVIGVPINMCAGEEILISAPLVGMGLTMGHAVAFALASTGICLASVPLLIAALGRRATIALVAVYLVVPFAVGLIVNLLPIAAAFGLKPF